MLEPGAAGRAGGRVVVAADFDLNGTHGQAERFSGDHGDTSTVASAQILRTKFDFDGDVGEALD